MHVLHKEKLNNLQRHCRFFFAMKIAFLNNKLFMQEYNTYAQDNLNWVDNFDKLRKGLFKKINSITIINFFNNSIPF